MDKRSWLNLVAIVPAGAMAFLDQLILPVALPAIGHDLVATNTALQWTVNSYLLAMAVFVLIGGKLGDRLGSRTAYVYGIAIFAFFSICCGLSPNIEFLVVSRALQGLGAAIMIPAQTSLIAKSYPPNARGRATGMVVSFQALFALLGPAVGGYLTETLSWRWIFWINVPMAALGILLSLVFLRETEKGKGGIDFPGFIYFSIFSFALSTLFMQAPDWGWDSKGVLICAILTFVSLWFLIRREKKAKHPFLDLSLFKHPVFVSINVSIVIGQFILMIAVFRTVYIENILGYSPAQTGLISSLAGLPSLFLAPFAGFLSDKITPKLPILIGYGFLIFSFFWLAFFSTPGLVALFTALTIFSMGMPLIFTPSYSSAMSAVPVQKLGVAFGLVATLRMLSATIGLSLIFLYVSTEQKKHLLTLGPRLAEIASFSSVHMFLGFLLIVAMVATVILHRRKSAHHLPDSPAEGWD